MVAIMSLNGYRPSAGCGSEIVFRSTAATIVRVEKMRSAEIVILSTSFESLLNQNFLPQSKHKKLTASFEIPNGPEWTYSSRTSLPNHQGSCAQLPGCDRRLCPPPRPVHDGGAVEKNRRDA
ncbi:MAG TPA: hypothetical protein VK327_04705 [Candidatus Paceibacterota bacterium]|nr:hypothetical protein [Candidatus Paceibacterota bacterium]